MKHACIFIIITFSLVTFSGCATVNEGAVVVGKGARYVADGAVKTWGAVQSGFEEGPSSGDEEEDMEKEENTEEVQNEDLY